MSWKPRIRTVAPALFLSFSLLAAAITCVTHPQVLLEDVNVVDVVNGRVKPHQDVLIAAGKIALIAECDRISRAGVPVRVYAGGKYLVPGLWDAHVQLRSSGNGAAGAEGEDLALYVAHGVTGVRALSDDHPEGEMLPSTLECAGVLCPRIVKAIVKGEEPAAQEAKESAGSGECPMLSKLRRDLGLNLHETILNPALAFVSQNVRDSWDRRRLTSPEPNPESLSARRETYEDAERRVKKRAGSGLPVLAGTDTGEPYTIPGDELHRELELLVKAGLSTAEALRAATIEPAKAFHLADCLGTVEINKDADLVLLEDDPLADIRSTRAIDAVLLRGRYLDRRELDRIIADTALKRN